MTSAGENDLIGFIDAPDKGPRKKTSKDTIAPIQRLAKILGNFQLDAKNLEVILKHYSKKNQCICD